MNIDEQINEILNVSGSKMNKKVCFKLGKILSEDKGFRKAGFYNVKTKEFKILKSNEFHNEQMTYKDFYDGWVRFGLVSSFGGYYCYISSTNNSFFKKAIDGIKNYYKDVNIKWYEIELFTDDTSNAIIKKVDEKGREVFENKNFRLSMKNIQNMIKSKTGKIQNGYLIIEEGL